MKKLFEIKRGMTVAEGRAQCVNRVVEVIRSEVDHSNLGHPVACAVSAAATREGNTDTTKKGPQ